MQNICLPSYIIYSMVFISIFTSSFLLYRHNKLNKYSRLLQEISTTDKLTKLFNRFKIDMELESEFLRYQRTKNPFSLILIDIDFFKKVNDTYGHLVGDDVLKSVAEILKTNIRDVDTIGRWGGEEFIIILPFTDIDGALNLAQKLRHTIKSKKIDKVGYITASFGIAQIKDDCDIEGILKNADEALYYSKENGRDMVSVNR